jgi:FMN-dependent NADH-azoreductase
VSRQLTQEFVKTWQAKHGDGNVVYRDLSTLGLSPIDAAWIGSAFTPAAARSEAQKQIIAKSDEFIAELKAADDIVVGVSMHNFGIPATLKIWIDLIARAGETFKYGANGPEGLVNGKQAYILWASGGSYDIGSPMNFVEPYLKAVFGFVGITNIKFVAAGGAAALMKPDADRTAFFQPRLAEVRDAIHQ